MRGWGRQDQWMEDWMEGGRETSGNKLIINEKFREKASGLVVKGEKEGWIMVEMVSHDGVIHHR